MNRRNLRAVARRDPVLPDVLKPGLRVVFCGTAAGAVSARRAAYYAGPGNRFWATLAEIGLTPSRLAPEDYRRLLGFGLGLTDVSKTNSGADSDIAAEAYDVAGLAAKIERFSPKILALHGKMAASLALGRPGPEITYGPQTERIGATRLFVLPSTSGAARGNWDIGPWQALGRAELAAETPKARAAQRQRTR